MFNRPLVKQILILSIVVAFLHKMALELYLYWTVWWFDIVMHFLGGVLIAFIFTFLFYISNIFKLPKNQRFIEIILIVGGVLVIGLMWEIWEIYVGFTDIIADKGDTILDIIMDVFGGFVTYLYLRKSIWQQN